MRARFVLLALGGTPLPPDSRARAGDHVRRVFHLERLPRARDAGRRRLHRARVREHLSRAGLRGDARAPRRADPVELRSRRARSPGARARRQGIDIRCNVESAAHRTPRRRTCGRAQRRQQRRLGRRAVRGRARAAHRGPGPDRDRRALRRGRRGAGGWLRAHTRSNTCLQSATATDGIALTPVAIAEGQAVARTLFGARARRIDHEHVADGGVFAAGGRAGRPEEHEARVR